VRIRSNPNFCTVFTSISVFNRLLHPKIVQNFQVVPNLYGLCKSCYSWKAALHEEFFCDPLSFVDPFSLSATPEPFSGSYSLASWQQPLWKEARCCNCSPGGFSSSKLLCLSSTLMPLQCIKLWVILQCIQVLLRLNSAERHCKFIKISRGVWCYDFFWPFTGHLTARMTMIWKLCLLSSCVCQKGSQDQKFEPGQCCQALSFHGK